MPPKVFADHPLLFESDARKPNHITKGGPRRFALHYLNPQQRKRLGILKRRSANSSQTAGLTSPPTPNA